MSRIVARLDSALTVVFFQSLSIKLIKVEAFDAAFLSDLLLAEGLTKSLKPIDGSVTEAH
jgi:hypothetical protein